MKRYNIIISLLFIVAIITPYILALINTPEGYNYTGFINYNLDNATYLSKMENNQGFVYQNMYNNFEQDGWYVFGVYSFIGIVSEWSGISSMLIFHLLKILLCVVFIYVLSAFLKQLQLSEKVTSVVLLFVLFGNTAEYIYYFLSRFLLGSEVEVMKHVAETLPFSSALFYPHILLALIFQCAAWIYSLRYLENFKVKNMLIVGIIFFLYSTVHPYSAVSTGLIIGIFAVVHLWKINKINIENIYPLLYMGLIPLPYLIIMLINFKTNIVLVSWIYEAVIELPHMFTTLIFYGFHIVFIIYFSIQRENRSGYKLGLLIWIWLSLVAVFIPFSSSIRFLEGIGIPFYILFGIWVFDTFKKKKKTVIIVSCFMLFHSMMLIVAPSWEADKDNYHWYLSEDTHKAYKWVKDNKDDTSLILSDHLTSAYLPAYSQALPFHAHIHETQGFYMKNEMWNLFINNPLKQWNSGWIERNKISHIIINRDYIKIDNSELKKLPIKEVYKNKTVSIFEIE